MSEAGLKFRLQKRWIASSNAEWCWADKRGGPNVADAVKRIEEAHPEIREQGCTIVVEPDTTAEQVREAYWRLLR